MDNEHTKKYLPSVIAGIIGSVSMAAFYWLVLFLITRDVHHLSWQFREYWYWFIPLIIGFGIQMSLFWYIRSGLHLSGGASKSAMAVGTGTSTVAMVACCSHHLADLLPILGLSAATVFLNEYRGYFFAVGLVFNMIGIGMMVYIIKNKKCFSIRSLIR